jgi:thiamine biosynthesis lipoprotein
MNTHTFRAMNTEWWLGAADRDGAGQPRNLNRIEASVHAAEARYSRFLHDSTLSRLNRERRVRDAGLAALVRHALAMHEATDGAFDVRVGAAMSASGYDRTFEALAGNAPVLTFAPPLTQLRVDVRGDDIRLLGSGTLDLGGIAKGWTVDRIAEEIERAGCHDYLVDGGGDIRAAGCDERGEPWTVGVGEGLAVRLENAAVCTSSTRRRRWRAAGEDAHHIIDPTTGAPSRHGIAEAVVVARDTTTADVLATTIIADPERGLTALRAMNADALVLRDGRWEMTEGMQRWLI